MSRRASRKGTGKMFAFFDQKQIQEYKEAFTMMDQDRDGVIGSEDLKEIYMSLGKSISDSDVKSMLAESKNPINFATFLNMFGEKLSGTDSEEAILNAFKLYDPKCKGELSVAQFKEILTQNGKPDMRISDQNFTKLMEGVPIGTGNNFQYGDFTRMITRGAADEN
ncbi:hypothetical protein GJ496_004971 [Pomphorhynchus laevis]|nr:hypothetical protein GJ496_004971 [Pomphorhynchus laevis]